MISPVEERVIEGQCARRGFDVLSSEYRARARMSVASARRRGGGGGGGGSSTFKSISTQSRPSFTHVRTPTFTTQAGLSSAVTAMAAGDYIQYTGSGVLTITTSASVSAFAITSKNPSSLAAIDFGTAQSYWGSATTGNYVKFTQTHASSNGFNTLLVNACSNLAIYGGEHTSTANGLQLRGALTNVYVMDAWVHDVGANGVFFVPGTTGGGVASIDSCTIQVEVGPNFAMNPTIDVHADKGTGMHGCISFDSSNGSSFPNNTIVLYVHDSLTAGGTALNGVAQPEGSGGSGVEFGQSTGSGTATCPGCKIYILAEDMHMIPNGTNPGSTLSQTGGNAINLWGNIPLTSLEVVWVEGNRLTGACVDGDLSSGWHSVAIAVTHGRHVSVNGSTAGGNISVPYGVYSNVTYSADCL